MALLCFVNNSGVRPRHNLVQDPNFALLTAVRAQDLHLKLKISLNFASMVKLSTWTVGVICFMRCAALHDHPLPALNPIPFRNSM